MPKTFFAMILALATTISASAHIWTGAATHGTAGQRAWRTSPCPPSYAFQKGFCLRVSPVRIATDARATADPGETTRWSKKVWIEQTVEKILDAPDNKADNANNDQPARGASY